MSKRTTTRRGGSRSASTHLASGERVRASETGHPDLFWALRGGGGNFGIVTEFEFRLHDTGTEVLAGPVFHTADRAREVLGFYRDFIEGAPDELSVYVNLRAAPDLDWIPADLRGKPVVTLLPFWSGNLDEGERFLRPLRSFGPPAADLVQRKPYLAHQAMFDATVPHGWGYYWKSHYLPPLTDAVIDVLAEYAWRKSSGASYTLLFHLGGQMAKLPDDHSAAGGRDAKHAVNRAAAGTPRAKDHLCLDLIGACAPASPWPTPSSLR